MRPAANFIGQVKYKLPGVDSAFIETPTYRRTWDGLDSTGYSRYLNGVRNVAVGDFTCQLGYNSKVVCNIRTVYAGNAGWNVNRTTVWGSWGVPHFGGIVGTGRRQRWSGHLHQRPRLPAAQRHRQRRLRVRWLRMQHRAGLG
jgi:hypothetical protein